MYYDRVHIRNAIKYGVDFGASVNELREVLTFGKNRVHRVHRTVNVLRCAIRTEFFDNVL